MDAGSGHRLPQPHDLVLPVPEPMRASADTITQIAMRNINFHVDDDVLLEVRDLRGTMHDLRGEHIIVLDDKETLELQIAAGEIALTTRSLTLLLNRYVFGFKGSPLKNLVVRTEGDQIVQTGVMHKIIDIPFEMAATLTVSDDGWIRISPTRMKIAGLDGEALLKAVRRTLQDMLDLRGGKGVRVVGNDLYLDPLVSLPPPSIRGRITAIRVEGDHIVQTFGSADSPGAAPLNPPLQARNYIYFRGGQLRFGKLYMVHTELMAIDADESDPFDFYLDYYHTQLVAGYHITMPNYGLVAYMPDFDDVGTPRGKVEPPLAGR